MILNRIIIDGLIFSILFGGMVTIIEIINPRYMLHNYPKELRQKVEPKTKTEQKQFKLIAIPMMLILLGYFTGSIVLTYSQTEITYWTIFLHSFLMLTVWNLFDLLIMDWLIFSTITPKFLILPGTKGDKAYKDYCHHINGSLGKGLILAIVAASILSSIAFLILRI